MNQQNKSTHIFIFGLICVFFCTAVLYLTSPSPNISPSSGKASGNSTIHQSNKFTATLSNPQEQGKISIYEQGITLLRTLQSGQSSSDFPTQLKVMKASVHSADPTIAAHELIRLLETGWNAPTGMDFDVGEEGVMNSTGCWRSSLLDLLGQTGPSQSARFSQDLLSQTSSQEEYALCLRNISWANFDGEFNKDIQNGVRNMLNRAEWLQHPEPALLEALDAATSTLMTKDMIEIVQSPSSPYLLRRGAFVSLDRMMLAEPLEVGAQILQNKSIFDLIPLQRASLLSRLDPSEPAQIQLLQTYLQTFDNAEEAEYFFSIFPHTNTFDSHRLITSWDINTDLQNSDLRIQNARTLAQSWLKQPEFSYIVPYLQKMLEASETY